VPEHARRVAVALYDQFENEHQVADWGGDELFNRMPRPRPVDDAPAPRFRPSLVVSEPGGSATTAREPAARGTRPAAAERLLALVAPPDDKSRAPAARERSVPRDRRAAARTAERAMLERADRLGLSIVEPAPEPAHRWDESGALIESEPGGRRTTVITGHPGGAPRPLPTVRAERRRSRTPAEWIGPQPERIVAWAFVLGLVLILIAITTA
jgi:hypothetical protein